MFAGSNFYYFSSDLQNKVLANNNYRKHFFLQKSLQSKYSLTKIRYIKIQY